MKKEYIKPNIEVCEVAVLGDLLNLSGEAGLSTTGNDAALMPDEYWSDVSGPRTLDSAAPSDGLDFWD